MRHALLLLAALASVSTPSAGAAQASGVVANGTSRTTDEWVADDGYINLDECIGAADTGIGPLELLWNVKLESGSVNGGVFRIYATNTAPGATEPRYCKTADDPNASPAVYAAQVGGDVDAIVGQTTENADDVPTADIAQAANPSGFTCDPTLADQAITVCVHYFASDGSGGLAASPSGWAVGALTLSLRRPPPPPSPPDVRGGEGALQGTWDPAPAAGSGQASVTGYRVIVTDEAGVNVITWKDVTDTEARIEGLANGTTYRFNVVSLSAAKNTSETGWYMEGAPIATQDFWEYYRGFPGAREQGGCAAGAAGPLALLGVAALLAALRRRA